MKQSLDYRYTGVLIAGLPGAGKTSTATRLAERGKYPVLAASAALAAYSVTNADQVEKWRRQYWSSGRNAPDAEVSPVLWDAFTQAALSCPRRPVLMDGYPRTVGQAHDFLRRGGFLEAFILLEVDPEMALTRIGIRAKSGDREEDESNVALLRMERERRGIDELLRLPECRAVLVRVDSGRTSIDDVCDEVARVLDVTNRKHVSSAAGCGRRTHPPQ